MAPTTATPRRTCRTPLPLGTTPSGLCAFRPWRLPTRTRSPLFPLSCPRAHACEHLVTHDPTRVAFPAACAGSVCAGRCNLDGISWYQLVLAPFVVQMMGEGFASNGGSMTRRLALAVSDGHHITVWSLTPLKSWHRSCCARIHRVLTGATAVSVLTVCPSGSGGDKEYFLLYAPSLHLGMFVPS